VQDSSRLPPPPETLVESARQLERQGDIAGARRIYLQLTEKFPNLATPYHRLALLACRENELSVADEHFRRATRLDPFNATILNDWGYMCYLREDLGEAERLLRLAESRAPQNGRIQNNLGVVLGRLGKLEASFQAFRKGGTEAESHANMAFVHVRRNEPQLAEQHYKQALKLDPNLKSAADALAKLAELKPEATLVLSETSASMIAKESAAPSQNTLTADDQPADLPEPPAPDASDEEPIVTKKPDRQPVTVTQNGSKIVTFKPKSKPGDPAETSPDHARNAEHEPRALPSDLLAARRTSNSHDASSRRNEPNPIRLAHGESRDVPADLDDWAGSEIVRAFIVGLDDADPAVRRYSAMTLACYGAKADVAVPALTTALDDHEPAVQEAAAIALAEIGPSAGVAVPHLIRKLKCDNTRVVSAAAWSLEKLGESVPQRAREVQGFYRQATELLEKDSLDGDRLAEWLNRADDKSAPSMLATVASKNTTQSTASGSSWKSLTTVAQFARNYPSAITGVVLLQFALLAALVVKVRRHRAAIAQIPAIAASSARPSAEYRNVVVIQQAASAPLDDSTPGTARPVSASPQIPLGAELPNVIFNDKSASDQRTLRAVFEQNRSWQQV
jgi:Tfp pilus assembly protein PilF